MKLPNPLASAARSNPRQPLLECGDDVRTAADWVDEVARVAGGLAAQGVEPGQVVALAGPPSAAFATALHAVGWLGAAAAPLPPTDNERSLASLGPHHVLDTTRVLPVGAPLPERDWPLDEARLTLLTSGTTGAPRVVTITTGQIVLSAFGSALRLGHDLGDRWLCCLPLHHVGGLSVLFRTAIYGTTAVLHRRFDAAAVAKTIYSGDCTLVSLVPTMLSAVLDAAGARPCPPVLRAVLLGGAAAPTELLERCRRLGLPVARTWGMTEAASQLATAFPGQVDGPLPPLPFVRISSNAGVLVAEGPVVGRRLVTADRGRVEPGGVVVEGRIDDVIVSGGENVDPAEIEAVLAAHPDVREVAVVGRADDRWGQRPVAYVVGELDPRELRAWCRERLPGLKTPDEIVVLDALPRTALGKVARGELEERAGGEEYA